jgi:glycosyltransferase involved in cell wall biosynthesis
MIKNYRITLVSQYFHPEVASTAQLMTDLCIGLSEKGFKVDVIAGQPSYSKASQKLPSHEEHKGVKIRRVWNTRLNKDKTLWRLINYTTFTISASIKLLFRTEKNPLLIVSVPPFSGIIGVTLNLIKKQKYGVIIYDLYPDIAEELGYIKKDGIISKIWKKLNQIICSRAEAVIVLGKGMKKRVSTYYKLKTKIIVIPNWADGNQIKPVKKSENRFAKQHNLKGFTVTYSGNIGLSHNLETILYAAKELENEDINFLIIGEGGKKEKLMDMASEFKLTNTIFLPFQPKKILPYSLSSGDVSVVSLAKGLEGLAVPSKIYTYLAAGQAIIALVNKDSEAAEIIEKYECGIRVDQEDVKGFVEAVRTLKKDKKLLERMQRNARKCFEENFEREQALDEYKYILIELNEKN